MASSSSLSESSCVGNYEAIIPCNIGGHIMFCFSSYRGGFLCCQTIIYWRYWPSCRRIMHWHINSSSCRTVMLIQKQCHLLMISRITSSQIPKKATERLYWSSGENLTRVIHVTGNSRWVPLRAVFFWLKSLFHSTNFSAEMVEKQCELQLQWITVN